MPCVLYSYGLCAYFLQTVSLPLYYQVIRYFPSTETPHVSARMVIDLVLTVLDRHRPYLLENFAGDFIQITLKYLLHFPQYYLEVPAERWKGKSGLCEFKSNAFIIVVLGVIANCFVQSILVLLKNMCVYVIVALV